MLQTELIWNILFLIPKGSADTHGIGLLEVLCKIAEDIIDTHIKTVAMFHDVLHGLRASRGTVTVVMDLKMAQEIDSIEQDPLLLEFLELRKSYNKLDCSRILQTLEGYGSGQKMRGQLEEFWENKEVFTRQNSYNRPQFRENRGTTQDELASTTLFNVTVDSVVRHWLSLMVEDEVVIQYGIVHVVEQSLGVFYIDDGILGSRDLEWLHGKLNVLIRLFRRIGLAANVKTLNTMTCQPGAIISGISEEAFGQNITGKGATYRE